MKNIKLILRKEDKIQDEKIFILPSRGGENKTYWHFKNMDVIFPNWLGFDIHNDVDSYIEYDFCQKCGYRGILIDKSYYSFDMNDIFSMNTSWDIRIRPEILMNGITKLDTDSIICYFIYNDKVRGIKINNDLFNFDTAIVRIKDLFDELAIEFVYNNELKSLNFIRSKIDGILDIEDYNECMKSLHFYCKNFYTKLLFERI